MYYWTHCVHLALWTRYVFVWKLLCSMFKFSCIKVHLLFHTCNMYINDAPSFYFYPSVACTGGAGIAQLVQRRLKSQAQYWREFESPVWRGVLNFQCRLSYGVRAAPACNRMHQHLCKSRTLAAIPVFGHKKMLHSLVGMDSAALAAAVSYLVRQPEFPARDNEALKKSKTLW